MSSSDNLYHENNKVWISNLCRCLYHKVKKKDLAHQETEDVQILASKL